MLKQLNPKERERLLNSIESMIDETPYAAAKELKRLSVVVLIIGSGNEYTTVISLTEPHRVIKAVMVGSHEFCLKQALRKALETILV